ncbi:MAG: Alpha-amylase precursor [Candidatus Izimaplasma bacterium HR2]|nr:MAG: Alpha-amylase precursor [Candidatus Izimaplasma bacterium HR2]
MKKIYLILLALTLVITLSACDNTDSRENTWNINDGYSIDQYVGDTLIDLSYVIALDDDSNDITSFIEIEGSYNLSSIGVYNLTLFVYDDVGTYSSVDIILNILELTCEMDDTQDKCLINVESISFTSTSLLLDSVYVGDFINLDWSILPIDAGNMETSITSSNEDVATVTNSGFVFGISEGTAIITITTIDGDFEIVKTITVTEKTCEQDPLQEKCVAAYLSDQSRIVTLSDENVSGTDYTEVYMNNKIYYQIYVRTYADSDENNVGDIQGIIDNLDYIKSLGVGGIWLMPIMESRSNHGYEIDDYYEIDSQYGTMQDFKDLVIAAELIGIDIIIDLVVNHMGAHNDIFQDVLRNGVNSDYYDWFTWIDSSDSRYGTKGSWGQTIWYTPSGRNWLQKTSLTVHSSLDGMYYAAYFSDYMPDLNFQNQAVIDYIYDVGTWWIEETGVAGFRMDAIMHIFGENEYLGVTNNTQANIDFLTGFNTNCEISDPDVYIVGEAWSWYGEYAKYYESGITAFNFDASYRIVDAINGTLGWSYSASLQEIYTEIEKYTTDYIDAPFLRNHDQDRISTVFSDDARELRMAAEAVLFLPGNPYIYYGDEVGMLGTRTYMIWGDYYDIITTNVEDYGVDTVSEQLADPNSLLNSYIDIGDARTNSLALMYGDFIPYTSTGLDGYYRVFENGVDKELVVVIHNFSSVTYREIPSEFTSYEILYSSYENNYGGISPKGTIVLKLPFDLLDDLTN